MRVSPAIGQLNHGSERGERCEGEGPIFTEEKLGSLCGGRMRRYGMKIKGKFQASQRIKKPRTISGHLWQ